MDDKEQCKEQLIEIISDMNDIEKLKFWLRYISTIEKEED